MPFLFSTREKYCLTIKEYLKWGWCGVRLERQGMIIINNNNICRTNYIPRKRQNKGKLEEIVR